MTSLTFQDIGLRPAQMKALEKKARKAGKSPVEFARQVLEKAILADLTFDEILRPVREDFRAKGITAADVEGIVRRARQAAGKPRRSHP